MAMSEQQQVLAISLQKFPNMNYDIQCKFDFVDPLYFSLQPGTQQFATMIPL
jgi:hypothetical protein